MAKHKTLNLIAGLASLGAWLWLFIFLHPRPAADDVRPHLAAGDVLAAEALKVLEPGGRIIVLARDSEPFQVPASQAQLEGFQSAMERAGKDIARVQKYQVDPLRVVRVPAADFFELLRQAKENDVIVSFLGPPELEAAQLAKLGTKRPRVLAVCSTTPPSQASLKQLFEQRLLWAAVVNRGRAPIASQATGLRRAFDQRFLLVTPDNAAETLVANR